MRGKSVALLVLALSCGLVASIGITRVMANRDGEAVAPAGETETIFVALEDISMGEVVTAQLLRLEQWPKDKIPPNALTRIEDVEGRLTRTRLYAGEPILDNKLYPKGASSAGAGILIPPGYRAVPVKVDLETGGSNMIRPGDRVDVLLFVAACPAKGFAKTTMKTILQDIKVFAVNNVVNADSDGEANSGRSIKASTISLLLTPEQTQQVALAAELGKIRLVLRSPEDDTIAQLAETTPGQVLDQGEGDREAENPVIDTNLASLIPRPGGQQPKQGSGLLALLGGLAGESGKTSAAVDLPKPGVAALQIPPGATEPERHDMRLVIGGEVRDVTLEESGTGGARRWRVLEMGFAPPGLAAAADLPPVMAASPSEGPATDPPEQGEDPSAAQENEEEAGPEDDEYE